MGNPGIPKFAMTRIGVSDNRILFNLTEKPSVWVPRMTLPYHFLTLYPFFGPLGPYHPSQRTPPDRKLSGNRGHSRGIRVVWEVNPGVIREGLEGHFGVVRRVNPGSSGVTLGSSQGTLPSRTTPPDHPSQWTPRIGQLSGFF
jgi:hypothetical protein